MGSIGWGTHRSLVDEHGCGLPVLFAIIKNDSAEEFAHALRAFDAALDKGHSPGQFKPATVMTDKSEADRKVVRCEFLLAAWNAHESSEFNGHPFVVQANLS